MGEDTSCPPEISSFQAIKALCGNINDSNKKRKLEIEQLDLPSPKHKFRYRGSSYPVLSPNENKYQEVESEESPGRRFDEKRDKGIRYEELDSHFESAQNNNFTEHADSEMSVLGKASLETNKYAKFNDKPSTSTAKHEFPLSRDSKYYLDGLTESHGVGDKGKLNLGKGEHRSHCIDEESQLCETLEEHLLEFGCHLGYSCSEESGNDGSEQCIDKGLQELFGLVQDNYVLSSGRCSTIEETQSVPRKPTIDQEFEEYFSSLMM